MFQPNLSRGGALNVAGFPYPSLFRNFFKGWPLGTTPQVRHHMKLNMNPVKETFAKEKSFSYIIPWHLFVAAIWGACQWNNTHSGALRKGLRFSANVGVSKLHTDGSEIRRSPVEVASLSHYSQSFIHPRWLAGFLPSLVSQFQWFDTKTNILRVTLPKTNVAPENRPSQKETSIPIFQPSIFRCYVSFREGNSHWNLKLDISCVSWWELEAGLKMVSFISTEM